MPLRPGGLKHTQGTITVLDFGENMLTENNSSLTNKIFSVRAERAILCGSFDKMTALVQRMEGDVRKLLYNVSTQVLETTKICLIALD